MPQDTNLVPWDIRLCLGACKGCSRGCSCGSRRCPPSLTWPMPTSYPWTSACCGSLRPSWRRRRSWRWCWPSCCRVAGLSTTSVSSSTTAASPSFGWGGFPTNAFLEMLSLFCKGFLEDRRLSFSQAGPGPNSKSSPNSSCMNLGKWLNLSEYRFVFICKMDIINYPTS